MHFIWEFLVVFFVAEIKLLKYKQLTLGRTLFYLIDFSVRTNVAFFKHWLAMTLGSGSISWQFKPLLAVSGKLDMLDHHTVKQPETQ